MKKLITIILISLFPLITFADFTIQENFDGAGYTNGTDINGLNGGAGWNAAWGGGAGNGSIQNSFSQTAPNSLKVTAGNPSRTFAQVTIGTTCFGFYDSGASNSTLLRFTNSGVNTIQFQMNGSNNLAYYNGVAFVNFATYTSNVWNRVCVKIDQTNQPFRAAYSLNSGAWTGFNPRSDATDTGVNGVLLFATAGVYYDSFSLYNQFNPYQLYDF